MDDARIYVDFNEMIEDNLVLLSKSDFKKDSMGNTVEFKEGMKVKIYSDDTGDESYLIAEGFVELNRFREQYSWTAACKWNCRIDDRGLSRIVIQSGEREEF